MTTSKNPSDQDRLFAVELLTIQQVAKWAKVSTKSIYRWIDSGKIQSEIWGTNISYSRKSRHRTTQSIWL